MVKKVSLRQFWREILTNIFGLEISINGTAFLNESKLVDEEAQCDLLKGDWLHLYLAVY
jgi:hypothetical protein